MLMAVAISIFAGCCNNRSASEKYYQSLPDEKAFDALCQRAIDEWKVPGMAVGVVKDGKVVFLKGFGNSVLEDSLNQAAPVTPQTKFILASTSKAFTSALLANVMDEYSEIKWDAPVRNYLPDFKLYDKWATEEFQVRDIMCHRTGFEGNALDGCPFFGFDRDGMVKLFASIKPSYSFRTTYGYNNEMFSVAAQIIEKYTGKCWEDALAERIYKPLKMNNSTTVKYAFWDDSLFNNGILAHPYAMSKAEGANEIKLTRRDDRQGGWIWLNAVAPAAAVVTTAEDMTHWVMMHMNHGVFEGDTVVSEANHKMLWTPQTITDYSEDAMEAYGQAWTIEQNNRGRYIRHSGLAYGYTTLVGFVPDLNLGFVFLTNNGTTGAPQAAIARDLIDMYYGVKHPENYQKAWESFTGYLFKEREPEVEPAVDSIAPLDNKAYVGEYKLDDVWGPAKVYMRSDTLFFSVREVNAPLRHKNGNTFLFTVPGEWADYYELSFTADGNKVKSLSFDTGDPFGEFVKVK